MARILAGRMERATPRSDAALTAEEPSIPLGAPARAASVQENGSNEGRRVIETAAIAAPARPTHPRGAIALWRVGAVLLALGALHVPVAAAHALHTGPEPLADGPVGFDAWRKVVLFGLATGVTCGSLAWVRGLLGRGRPLATSAAWTIAAAALVEVSLIALQPWRGERSHFNDDTPLDAAIAWTIDGTALLLTVGIAVFTLLSLREPLRRTDGTSALGAAMSTAVRAGLSLLLAACAFGVVMLVVGTERVAQGLPADGKVGDAGLLKFVHGMPLHAIQVLPMIAWFGERAARSRPGGGDGRAARAVVLATLGFVLWTAYASWQTFSGRARFDTDWFGAALLGAGSACVAVPMVLSVANWLGGGRRVA
jgi:hypothetical protein